MSKHIDYNDLRARTLGSGNEEEAVTVNTRALIDKVLARTVLRELLQNAADASATRVTIKFETLPSTNVPVPQTTDSPSSLLKHAVLHHTLRRLLVTNNGQPFGANDWSRLKRIAEGNPDETKIGAFGVGFYSVFADCEEPFVSSGKEAMAFYWKGNSLFTRRLQLDAEVASSETTFVLDYRNRTSPLPGFLSLCQFLATSLTFVGLQEIELWLDEWNMLKLSKKASPSVGVNLPKDVEMKTSEGMMKVIGVERESVQMDADVANIVGWRPSATSSSSNSAFGAPNSGMHGSPSLRTFFSRLTAGPNAKASAEKAAREESLIQQAISEDLGGRSRATVFLRISTANIRTSITASFAQELERATKKPPPKTTKLAVLTSSYDENVASEFSQSGNASQTGANVFASVLPSKSGKVFIGFPTAQTTGLNAHISAPSVIPTVERESIDLVAQKIRTYNVELLRATGIVLRVAWSCELIDIKEKLSRLLNASKHVRIGKEEIANILPETIHLFKQFTFQESTPSPKVGQIIEEAFWTCNKTASIEILSTRGVLPSHEVRVATEDLSFVEGIPVLPEELLEGANAFITKLRDFGLVSGITISDIQKELGAKTLDGNQLAEFTTWAGRKASSGEINGPTMRSLLDVAIATLDVDTSGSKQGSVLMLGNIKYFINPSRIPADVPVPPDTMPFRFTKNLTRAQLEAIGWEDLQIIPWLRWLIENTGGGGALDAGHDLTHSSTFASHVLPIVSKQWDGLSQSSKSTVVDLLVSRTVIPTKLGMRKPTESYFPAVKLFEDLPVVVGLHGVKDKLLAALGVRKTVELGVVFDRLMTSQAPSNGVVAEGKWSHVDLICYLASVRDDIPLDDIKRLKNTPICPAEVYEDPKRATSKLFTVAELFEPRDSLRSLGFPILQWPGIYRPGTIDGRFLASLGLRAIPTVPELIEVMAKATRDANLALRDHALTYFIANHHTNGYARFDYSTVDTPFLPLQGEDPKILVTPTGCFTSERASVLGFPILRTDLHSHALKFGVKPDPNMPECVNRLLKSPPRSRRVAKEVFGYFAGRLGEVGTNSVERLGNASIVPVFPKQHTANATMSEKSDALRYLPPKSCFLGDSEVYGDIFDFVDFGQEANTFLLKCGSKHEPTKTELAYIVVREPARLLNLYQSPEKYLNLLRNLADSLPVLRKDKALYKEMRRAPFLLAYKDISTKSAKDGKNGKVLSTQYDDLDEEEEVGIKEWSLASASQIILVDDFISYNLFKGNLLAAPQEETLEEFYWNLGAPTLSAIVEEEPRIGPSIGDQRPAAKLQKQVYERSRLFLHDNPADAIKHDARWLEKNLTVQSVQSISLRRTLRGHNMSHTERRTAAVTNDQRKGWVLSITGGGYDLFQVSQALVNLLLTRPRPHSTMMLEMLLGTDLLKLRARGYNVERILRAKAAEARIVEDQRQKQLEEERKQIQEEERNWKESQSEKARREQEKQLPVPGAFADSPDHKSQEQHDNRPPSPLDDQRGRKPRGLFSSLSQRFGLNDERTSKQIQSFLGNNNNNNNNDNDNASNAANDTSKALDPPPPYTQEGPKQPSQPGHHPDAVTAPHQLHQNLVSAISASRAHDSSSLYSRPQTNNVKETASYCDDRPGQDISYFADASNGIKIFFANGLSDKSAFLKGNAKAMNAFANLLIECGNVFGLPQKTIHIFYDQSGSTIAFNRQGSLFCNFRFFEQLHWAGQQQAEKRAEALVYWWVVLCHELAHNLVGDHSADHSFYTENFVAQYFPKVMVKVVQYSGGAGSAGNARSSLLDVD
ncbi:MAG: hypothetical protein M1827_003580 [Pycnora praestabilis]|nr:MAG: hypothetical protein M1827_003580 [Pycnora praestabilis]